MVNFNGYLLTSENYLFSWVALTQAISLLCWLLVCSEHTCQKTHSDRSFHYTQRRKRIYLPDPSGRTRGGVGRDPTVLWVKPLQRSKGEMLDRSSNSNGNLDYLRDSLSQPTIITSLLRRCSPLMCGHATGWLEELGSDWKHWKQEENRFQTLECIITATQQGNASATLDHLTHLLQSFSHTVKTSRLIGKSRTENRSVLYLNLCRLPLGAISILSSCIQHKQLSIALAFKYQEMCVTKISLMEEDSTLDYPHK